MSEKVGFNTVAIHSGAQPDPATGARATPIYQTSSYVFENTDHAADLFAVLLFLVALRHFYLINYCRFRLLRGPALDH